MSKKKTFKVAATLDHLDELMDYLVNLLEECQASFDVVFKFKLCFEEIFVNICHYAYDPESGEIEAGFDLEGNSLTIILLDSGRPYNPLEKEDPDLHAPMEERPVGGLGIFLTKTFLDEMKYEYQDGRNINIMIKKIS